MKTKKNKIKNRKIFGGDDDPNANTIDDGTIPIFKTYFPDKSRLKDIFKDSMLYSRLIRITPNLNLRELAILFFKTNQLVEKKYPQSKKLLKRFGKAVSKFAYLWMDGVSSNNDSYYINFMIQYLMYLYEIMQLIGKLNNYNINAHNIKVYIQEFINLQENPDNFTIFDIDTLSNNSVQRISFESIDKKIQALKEIDNQQQTNNSIQQSNTEDILNEKFDQYLDYYKRTFSSNSESIQEINLQPFSFKNYDDRMIQFDINMLLSKPEKFKERIDSIPDENEEKLGLLETFLAYAGLINSFYFFKKFFNKSVRVILQKINFYNRFKENVKYLKSCIDTLSNESYAGGGTKLNHKKIIKNKTRNRTRTVKQKYYFYFNF